LASTALFTKQQHDQILNVPIYGIANGLMHGYLYTIINHKTNTMKINLNAIIILSLTGLTIIASSCRKEEDYQPIEIERRAPLFDLEASGPIIPVLEYKKSHDPIAADTIKHFILPEGFTLSNDGKVKLETNNTEPVLVKKRHSD
jgi:hypothetical protein